MESHCVYKPLLRPGTMPSNRLLIQNKNGIFGVLCFIMLCGAFIYLPFILQSLCLFLLHVEVERKRNCRASMWLCCEWYLHNQHCRPLTWIQPKLHKDSLIVFGFHVQHPMISKPENPRISRLFTLEYGREFQNNEFKEEPCCVWVSQKHKQGHWW